MSDPSRADEVLQELQGVELEHRSLSERRLRLVLEASRLGVTVEKIGERIGYSQSTVSNWIRAAHSHGSDSQSGAPDA